MTCYISPKWLKCINMWNLTASPPFRSKVFSLRFAAPLVLGGDCMRIESSAAACPENAAASANLAARQAISRAEDGAGGTED